MNLDLGSRQIVNFLDKVKFLLLTIIKEKLSNSKLSQFSEDFLLPNNFTQSKIICTLLKIIVNRKHFFGEKSTITHGNSITKEPIY